MLHKTEKIYKASGSDNLYNDSPYGTPFTIFMLSREYNLRFYILYKICLLLLSCLQISNIRNRKKVTDYLKK